MKNTLHNIIVRNSNLRKFLATLSLTALVVIPGVSNAMIKPVEETVSSSLDITNFTKTLAHRQHSLIGSEQCSHVVITVDKSGNRVLQLGKEGQHEVVRLNLNQLPHGQTGANKANTKVSPYKITYTNYATAEDGVSFESNRVVIARYFDLIDYLTVSYRPTAGSDRQRISCRNLFVKKKRRSGKSDRI